MNVNQSKEKDNKDGDTARGSNPSTNLNGIPLFCTKTNCVPFIKKNTLN